MHVLQPKHTKISKDELAELLKNYNIAIAQLPKISKKDPAAPEGCEVGDVLKIERKTDDNVQEYYRVVV